MCLETICESTVKKGIGYKVVREITSKYYPVFQGHKPYNLSNKDASREQILICEDRNVASYLTGYHIFKKEADARMYARDRLRGYGLYVTITVLEVEFGTVTAEGEQIIFDHEYSTHFVPCVVARNMKILRKVCQYTNAGVETV